MSQATLEKAIEIVKELEPAELKQIKAAVDARVNESVESEARERFHRALLEAGLVKEFKTGPYRPDSERPLVTIKGKPLSETIIEDRG